MTICPQLFRASLVAEEIVEQLELLQKSMAVARSLAALYVRTFAFWRESDPEDVWNDLVETFGRAADAAAAQGITLLLENEALTYAVSGGEAAGLLHAVDHPALRAI